MNIYNKILGIIDKKFNFSVYFLFFLIIISMFLEMMSIAILVPFFDIVLSNNKDNFLIKLISYMSIDASFYVQFSLIFLASIFILKTLILSFIVFYKHNFILKFNVDLTSRVINRITNFSKNLLIKDNTSEYHRLILIDVNMVTHGVYQLINVIGEVTIILGSILVLLYYEPSLLVILILFSTFIFFLYHFFLKRRISSWGDLRKFYDTNRRKFLSDLINTNIFSKLLNINNIAFNNFYKSNRLTLKYYQLREVWNEFPRSLLELIAVFFIIVLFFYFYITKVEIKEAIPILSLFTLASLKIVMSVNRLIISFNQIFFAKTPIEKINNYLNPNKEYKKQKYKIKKFNSLIMNKICFGYNSKNIFIKNLDLKINKNDFVGIKGSSGSGKTTLLYLLIGLLKPTSGKILLNNLSNYNHFKLNIGLVSQNPYLINDTLKNNIAFGVERKKISETKIFKLLKLMNLDELSNNPKKSLDFMIDENASNISIGQAQRISIARCLYFDPDIIVLDEPTSSLDKKNEDKVFEILNKLKNNKTIIIISHKSKIFKNCNKIIDLDKKF